MAVMAVMAVLKVATKAWAAVISCAAFLGAKTSWSLFGLNSKNSFFATIAGGCHHICSMDHLKVTSAFCRFADGLNLGKDSNCNMLILKGNGAPDRN